MAIPTKFLLPRDFVFLQMLKRIRLCFYAVFRFYNEGFRNMTWGRQLWLLILIKLFILFVVLRIFSSNRIMAE